jgi:hypothetical protein
MMAHSSHKIFPMAGPAASPDQLIQLSPPVTSRMGGHSGCTPVAVWR